MRLRRLTQTLLFFVAISSTLAFAQMRWVTAQPVANMYSAPSADSDVTSQAIYGVTVVQTKPNPAPKENIPEGWIYVKTPDDYLGWVQRNQFLPLDPSEDYAGKDKRVVTVTNRGANVYRETDVTKHAPLLVLPFEVALEVTGVPAKSGERWLQVKLVDGREAYVQRGDVQDRTGKALTIDQAIDLAKKFLGVTYTWGGTSSFGYDCSGFMQMLMRQRGIIMPRDADVQAAWTGLVPVKREELKPGDLLYFGSSAKDITHTGMYIGNGEFIHDTTHDHPMVQISRLADQPWTKLLVASRRAK
jgi:gamma-D-glutamyl-L-lysine dipeptidyl-peptidase